MNDYSVYLLDALEQVLGWGLPDDDIADAVNAQAHLMTGYCPDYYYENNQTSTHHR